jgi:hypothetical protein
MPQRTSVLSPMASPSPLFFGDGSDGNVTINSGTTTLSRDMFYNNLTLSGSGVLNTNGWRVFVAGTLDITAAPAGAIINNGTVGGNASATNSGGAAPANTPVNSVGASPGGLAGAAGKPGGTGAGTAGAQVSAGGIIVNGGGNGGAGASGAGTNAGAAAIANSANNYTAPTLLPLVTTNNATSGATPTFVNLGYGLGGSSAPSGGGDGAQNGGASGAGGGPGGLIFIAAAIINRGASTAVGAIQAKGAAAGSGFAPTAGNTGGAGGSGGGGGGYIIIVVGVLIGAVATNVVDISAGNGAAGLTARGTGIGGDGGNSGQGGRLLLVNFALKTMVTTTGSAQVTGTAHSGINGGAGATAATDRVSL